MELMADTVLPINVETKNTFKHNFFTNYLRCTKFEQLTVCLNYFWTMFSFFIPAKHKKYLKGL